MSSVSYERALRLTLPYMRGKDVLAVQSRLSKQSTAALPVSGVFDYRTREAVKSYQQAHKSLTPDGIVGPKTWGSLFGTTRSSGRSEARTITAAGVKPSQRPQLSAEELDRKIAHLGIDRQKYPLIVVGIRGYFGENERGIYDDALFVHSTRVTVGFNGNTDPSRSGHNHKLNKGFAVLNPGLWCAYKFDKHKGSYDALCQRAGEVAVTRDCGIQEKGYFGINIHKGSHNSTSSEGCQTIPPDHWDEFYKLCRDEAIHYFGKENLRDQVIPYALILAEENEASTV